MVVLPVVVLPVVALPVVVLPVVVLPVVVLPVVVLPVVALPVVAQLRKAAPDDDGSVALARRRRTPASYAIFRRSPKPNAT